MYTNRHMAGRGTFGQRVKYIRELRGLTQRELADLIGVHSQTISEWERDTLSSLPPAELLREAAEKLRIAFMWFAFGDGKPPAREPRASA